MKNVLIPVVCALAVAAVSVVMVFTPETEICAAPVVSLGEIDGFTSERLSASESEINILPADTEIVKRLYTSDRVKFVVTAVIGGKTKSSIHRPELCLPSQGFLMSDPRSANIAGVDWRLISLNSGPMTYGFAYTFFNQAGYHTSSHIERIFVDVWDRSVKNRIDRWVMVTVFATEPERLDDFLGKLEEVIK